MAEKRQNQWLLEKQYFYCFQQCQNKVCFQRNGSRVVLKFLLIFLKGLQCFLFITEHLQPVEKCNENFDMMLEPFI